jgi:hypothetical protein
MSATSDISQLLAGLGAFKDKGIKAAVQGLNNWGEKALANAQEICPVETGALQASGTATPAELKGDVIEKTIGFNTDYAAARHERPPEHDAGTRQNPRGQWKFLETAINEMPPLGGYIAKQVEGVKG